MLKVQEEIRMDYFPAGTPLGQKVMDVAQKVATNTAEELKRAAAENEEELPGR